MSKNAPFIIVCLSLAVATGFAPRAAEAADAIQGQLVLDQRGRISAQMTGERSQRVTELAVRVGDTVKKGDRLAKLDTEQLEADRVIAQRAFDEAEASVEVAKANVARAKLNYDRRVGLKGSAAFNRAGLEDADVELQSAESQLKSVQSIAKRRAAEVARIEVEIRLAEIVAPYDGRVLEILTSVGASVTQGAPDLLTLLDLSQIEIAVEAGQDSAARLTPGQTISYVLEDGQRRTAQVRAVLPTQTGAGVRLLLEGIDVPLAVRRPQPVQVFLGT